jgi:hypothetical protein
MNLEDKIKAIKYLLPNADFVATDESIEFLNGDFQAPTDQEIQAAWNQLTNQLQAEAEAKAAQKAALLDRLGITEDEAKLLLA